MSLLRAYPEAVIQYAWKTLAFHVHALHTLEGKPIQLLKQGLLNRDQGPDFLDAQVNIGGTVFHGQVEIHVRSREWYEHGHHTDPLYNGVILHVVVETEGKPVLRQDGTAIPELVLGDRLLEDWLNRYDGLMLEQAEIACQNLANKVPHLHKQQWLGRLVVERMEQKSQRMAIGLQARKGDWVQLIWEEVMAYMGGPVNQDSFRLVAEKIPWKIAHKHAANPRELAALLFGMGGLLPTASEEPYVQSLIEDWTFLRAKYRLEALSIPVKLMRMRPAAFPTLRWALLAEMLHLFPDLMELLEPENWADFLALEISANEYWDRHYLFGRLTKPKVKRLGVSQKMSLLINVFAPMGFLYRKKHGLEDEPTWLEEALARLPAERNRYTRALSVLELSVKSAFDSQGAVQLYKHYCQEKRCLECGIGLRLMRAKKGDSLRV